MAEITNRTRSIALGADNVTYFETITTDYDDGGQLVEKKPIGKLAVLLDTVCEQTESRALQLATDARGIARAREVVANMNTDDSTITALTGQSPLAKIQARYQAELLANGWTIDDGTNTLPIVFTVNAQGNLRYNVNGTGAKAAKIYGAVIRLNNYPAAPTDTDFFLSENGKNYFSLPNKLVKIKKP